MKKILLVFLVVVSAFAGGILSSYLFQKAAFVQDDQTEREEPPKNRFEDLLETTKDILVCKKLIIRDDDNRTMARLSSSGLILYDKKGNMIACLNEKLGLWLLDKELNRSFYLDCNTGLSLINRESNNRVILNPTGLYVFQHKGDQSTELDLDGIRIFDKDQTIRAALGSTDLEYPKTGTGIKTALSSLVLFDKEGKVIFEAPRPSGW